VSPKDVFPVYVPTRGRSSLARGTLTLLVEAGIVATMVVEPREVDDYTRAFPAHQALVLPANDKGLVFSRNFIMQHARINGGWFWMIDDDVTGFFKTVDRRNIKVGALEALIEAQRFFAGSKNAGQASLEYAQIAWSAKKTFSLNSYCDVVVCINADATKSLNYREAGLKVDRDFTLQVLASGRNSCRVISYSFAAPKNGSNKGGLHDEYAAGKEAASSRWMCETWGPAICTPHVKKDGRPDVKINWKFFQPWKNK